MALKDIFTVNRKTFFNPSAWLGFNEIKKNTAFIGSTIRNILTPATPGRTESFEAAVQRLQLTEEDISKKKQTFLGYAIGFLILGTAAFLSSFYYLFYHKTLSGFVLALCVAAFLLAQAFRFHFWYFQMKHRKLGCTFTEWRQGKISDNEEG